MLPLALLWQIKSSERILTDRRLRDLESRRRGELGRDFDRWLAPFLARLGHSAPSSAQLQLYSPIAFQVCDAQPRLDS